MPIFRWLILTINVVWEQLRYHRCAQSHLDQSSAKKPPRHFFQWRLKVSEQSSWEYKWQQWDFFCKLTELQWSHCKNKSFDYGISTEQFNFGVKFRNFTMKQCTDARKQREWVIFLADVTSNCCKCAMVNNYNLLSLGNSVIMSTVMGQNPDKFFASAQKFVLKKPQNKQSMQKLSNVEICLKSSFWNTLWYLIHRENRALFNNLLLLLIIAKFKIKYSLFFNVIIEIWWHCRYHTKTQRFGSNY